MSSRFAGTVDEAEVGTYCDYARLCRNPRGNLRAAAKHCADYETKLHVWTVRLRGADPGLDNDYRQLCQHTLEEPRVRSDSRRE